MATMMGQDQVRAHRTKGERSLKGFGSEHSKRGNHETTGEFSAAAKSFCEAAWATEALEPLTDADFETCLAMCDDGVPLDEVMRFALGKVVNPTRLGRPRKGGDKDKENDKDKDEDEEELVAACGRDERVHRAKVLRAELEHQVSLLMAEEIVLQSELRKARQDLCDCINDGGRGTTGARREFEERERQAQESLDMNQSTQARLRWELREI